MHCIEEKLNVHLKRCIKHFQSRRSRARPHRGPFRGQGLLLRRPPPRLPALPLRPQHPRGQAELEAAAAGREDGGAGGAEGGAGAGREGARGEVEAGGGPGGALQGARAGGAGRRRRERQRDRSR